MNDPMERAAQLAEIICVMTKEAIQREVGTCELEHAMVEKYGESVTREQAAEILRVTPQTISNMTVDGRLCAGVSVRTIARFISDGRPSAQKAKHIERYQKRRAASC